MTNQEFFTKCVTHVLSQEVRCESPDVGCAYAGPNGTACAIGVFMPREMAERADQLADSGIMYVLSRLPEVREFFSGVDSELMRQCQTAHDRELFRDEDTLKVLRNKFLDIAETYGLEMPS